jgi:hypothetical protein
MSRPIRLGLLVVAAATAWLVWGWLRPGDEAEIRRALGRVADAFTSREGEGDIVRLGRLAALRDELHPDILVEAGPPIGGLLGRDAVLGAASRTGATLREMDVRFAEIEIAVGADAQGADVALVAEARFREGGRPGRGFEARELELLYVRHDGRWVIREVRLVRALQPLP